MMPHDIIIADRYQIIEKIGSGKFGAVYKGQHIKTNDMVAIKMEPQTSETQLLKYETRILRYLSEQGCRHLPPIYWYGKLATNFCLVMPYYERSLYHFVLSAGMIEQVIANLFMKNMVDALQSIHEHGVIHRDIKPQNIMMSDTSGNLALIDFGLAILYKDNNGEHIKDNVLSGHMIAGTPKYASQNVLSGHSPSRRDDLISLGYIYIWMLCREIPTDKSWEMIGPMTEKLGRSIHRYIEYCYQLQFEDRPHYGALKELFCKRT